MPSPFIESVRTHIRARNYSRRTEKTYIYWIVYYIRFHRMAHPETLGDQDIVRFFGVSRGSAQCNACYPKDGT